MDNLALANYFSAQLKKVRKSVLISPLEMRKSKEGNLRKISEIIEAKVVKEPNLLIEAKQRFTRDEAIVWVWLLANAKFYRDFSLAKELIPIEVEELKGKEKPFLATSVIDLKELAERYPEVFDRKTTYYFKQVLKRMEEKVIFEVDTDRYIEAMKELGYGYLVKDLEGEKIAYFGIATILRVVLTEDGKLKIVFSPYVSPLILELKKRFTLYEFEEVLKLKSRYAIILYRFFKEQLGVNRNEFSLSTEEVALLFNLEKNLKAGKLQTRDLKNKYIKPAVKEINEKTRLKVEFEAVRRGRGGKIVGFRFKVKEQQWIKDVTTKELLENFDLLEEWFKKAIRQIVKDLSLYQPVKETSIVQSLLSLKRINPAVAIWFLLHYPKSEAKLYAWEHIKWVDNHPRLDLPERYLQHTIRVPKKELDFLLDQRVKHAIVPVLQKLLKEWGIQQEHKQIPKEMEKEQEEIEIRNPLVRILVREILQKVQYLSEEEKQKLKKELNIEDFRSFLKKLILTEDIPNLQKVRVTLENLKPAYKELTWIDGVDPFDLV